MDGATVVWLSRLQFGLTAAFHYLYPPLSIGLAVFLVAVEALYMKTGDPLWRQVARFWTRVFALTFAIGVATGLVMEFEFGTNWAAYSRFVGDVFGSALAAEGIFAFFLESGFLALLLFGWDVLPARVHFLSTLMVAFGAHFSAIWIVVANSWMQTPAGYHIVQGPNGARAEITDFWALVFNPSSVTRLAHVVLGAWMAGAFLVMSVAAWYLLKDRHRRFALASIRVGAAVALAASMLQVVVGHQSVLYVAKHQPVKFAAMEGQFHTERGAPLRIGGWPDPNAGVTRFAIEIPGGLSFLATGDSTAEVPGLDQVPRSEWPIVEITHLAFQIMLFSGIALLAISAWFWTAHFFSSVNLDQRRLLLTAVAIAAPLGFIGLEAGWFVTEVGRQPWIIQRVMRTSDAVTPAAGVPAMFFTFTGLYVLLGVTVVVMLARIAGSPRNDT